MTSPHEKLVQDASRGEPAAVDDLIRSHLPGLLAYVHLHAGAKLRARESTIDIVQSACREVLQDIVPAALPSESSFKHWLYTAAERKILDRVRYWAREKREAGREVGLREELSSAEARGVLDRYAGFYTPSQHATAREELQRVQIAFTQLPEAYREVVLLSRVVGLSHAEIGEKTGRSEGAVRMLLHRALARLARLVGPRVAGS